MRFARVKHELTSTLAATILPSVKETQAKDLWFAKSTSKTPHEQVTPAALKLGQLLVQPHKISALEITKQGS